MQILRILNQQCLAFYQQFTVFILYSLQACLYLWDENARTIVLLAEFWILHALPVELNDVDFINVSLGFPLLAHGVDPEINACILAYELRLTEKTQDFLIALAAMADVSSNILLGGLFVRFFGLWISHPVYFRQKTQPLQPISNIVNDR